MTVLVLRTGPHAADRLGNPIFPLFRDGTSVALYSSRPSAPGLRMRRLLPFLVVLLSLVPVRADSLTVRDIVDLSKAGLGDDVLLALIEVDPSIFAIDSATLKMLKDAGVSQKVIVAMIRSGRTPTPASEPTPSPSQDTPIDPTPTPQVIVIDHHDSTPAREVYVPVYVPAPSSRRIHHDPVTVTTNPSYTTDRRFIPSTGLSAPVSHRTDIIQQRIDLLRVEEAQRARNAPSDRARDPGADPRE